MRVWSFALRSLVRQPGRAVLGVLGIAAVGALLFDMLLLSRGLLVSLRTMLDSAGYDVRVVATDSLPLMGPPIVEATETVAAIATLPEVDEVVPFRVGKATADDASGHRLDLEFIGVTPGARRPWRVVAGRDLDTAASMPPPLLVNRDLARRLHLATGSMVSIRGVCSRSAAALPLTRFRVAGIADFVFDSTTSLTAIARLPELRHACGVDQRDDADLLLVASKEPFGADAAVRAIRKRRPDLHAYSNEELVERFQQVGFSYFRQISTVLSTVTLFFAFLLISVLLTVSVNQRLGEIAALRALGLARARVVADVLCQSVLLVGAGGLLSLPLGVALARWLDTILRAMPDIPRDAHFFVFEPRALALHAALLTATAIAAALYPMRLVSRLPIAATLRNEVVT
jgi:ABC-type lipoprotein release transport system permease subunit